MALVLRGFLSPESLSSMPIHPSQIYSSINALVLAFLTTTYFRYRSRDGAVLAMGMLTYPITRFAIEYLRGDEMGQFGTSFTISQWVSMGIFGAGLVFTFWLNRRPKQITLAGEPTARKLPGTQKTLTATSG
jgi:phosphatidylglycerol:prolipoprotein diacylglycerol transferase